MPTYEYECLSCRQRFERKQSFSEEPVKLCPSCGGEVRKVLHAPGIVFKGSGWYVTDSRKSSDSSEGAAASPAAADGASANGAAKAGEAKSKAAEGSGGSGGSSEGKASGSDSSGASGDGGKRGSPTPKSGQTKAS
jgi:putative FmdB family regulatory protein